MKARELKKLYRNTLQAWLPNYICHGRLLYRVPLDLLLKGFYFESSAFDHSFTVECFIQPMYIPKEHFVLSIGRRLGGKTGRWFEPHELQTRNGLNELRELLEKQGLPFHAPVETPGDLAAILQADIAPATPHRQEAIAYSMCLDVRADVDEVRVAFHELQNMLRPDLQIPWVRAMNDRAIQLLAIFNENPDAARRLLERWAAHTREALNLHETASEAADAC
jgi:hypothetical protein